ncbi:protein HflC [Insulibacter thermoxylanivorax]|uniref:Protein HflC n=1 Tax=Insulibacter thermoxylanivorax TaxID=2749268 RepID=A0A916QCW3_9BACL|nr:protease modulator HflC [Insulibacter thermoxylanivorax]GFR37229.1 protein HflC [Insulibacter thermoxylanivorax]
MKKGLISTVIIVLLAVVLGSGSLFIVKEDEYEAVMQFGEAVRIVKHAGLHVKVPFLQTTKSLPKYQMVYDSQPSNILTKDQKPIIVDNYTVWRISDPNQFLRTVREISIATERIENAVYSTVRRKLSQIEYGDIISENTARSNLNAEITEEVSLALGQLGIEIVDVRIKRTDLPEENKQSVYNRMISDRKAMATRYLSEGEEEKLKITSNADREAIELIAEAEAKAKQIIAEGEQEAAKIYNEAYSKDPEFYRLYRTLQSYVTTFEGEPVIMIPIDSPYMSILFGR